MSKFKGLINFNAKKFTFFILFFIFIYLSYFKFFDRLYQKKTFQCNFDSIKFKNIKLSKNENGGIKLQTSVSHMPLSFHLLLGRFSTSEDINPVQKIFSNKFVFYKNFKL